MDFGITSKTAVVLGASRGLGRGVAEALAGEGANLFLVSRDGDRLAAAADRIRSDFGVEVSIYAADLLTKTAPLEIAKAALAVLSKVDILVNNTGGPPAMPVSEAGGEIWSQHFQAMVGNVIALTNAFLPSMRAQRWGRVITIVSSGVVQPIDRLGLSNTLRSALVGWSKTLSNEVARDGITVNCVAPGRIHTDRVDELDAAASRANDISVDEVVRRSHAAIPMGRYGKVTEFAAAATFLASEPASYITGSVVRVDGGLIRSV